MQSSCLISGLLLLHFGSRETWYDLDEQKQLLDQGLMPIASEVLYCLRKHKSVAGLQIVALSLQESSSVPEAIQY